MSAYLHSPTQSNKLLPLCDVNWGAQDQSLPDPSSPLEPPLFTNISLSGFIVFFNGQLHWISKQQRITARSSVEVEIYATDKCVKNVLRLKHLIMDSDVTNISPPTSLPIQTFNDNGACVCWSKSTTTKGLQHMSIHKNAVHESVQNKQYLFTTLVANSVLRIY